MPDPAPAKNDPKNIFAWCMYDWANSAYITTAVGLLPIYFASAVVGSEGLLIGSTRYKPETLWGAVTGLATFLTFVSAPILGAVADFSATKKRFLLAFAYAGATCTLLLYSCRTGDVFRTLLLYLVAQVGFTAANVFYDAFLPQITTDDRMDWVSGKGYSYGYLGGGLQFALALALVAGHDRLGISLAAASRIGIATAGLWWAGFTLFTARHLREAPANQTLPAGYRRWPGPLGYAALGVARTLATARRARQFRQLALFLVAFMLYDDGIQTVINMATIYGHQELKLSPITLMLTLLIIQAIAIFGSLLFSRMAGRLGTKRTVMFTLVLWCGVVIYAYFIQNATQYVLLGVVVGLILGGSQALSRSFYGSMIPEQASAEFYGFYTVFSKFASMWGPWIFAVVKQLTGSSRLSIVSLVVLFVAGLVLLALVDEEKARAAKDAPAF